MYSTAVVRPTRTTNDLENDSATITDITARTQTYIYTANIETTLGQCLRYIQQARDDDQRCFNVGSSSVTLNRHFIVIIYNYSCSLHLNKDM